MNKYELRKLSNRLLRHRLINLYNACFTTISDNIDGHKIHYQLNTDIGEKLFFDGHFEKEEISICEKFLSKNSIVLDVGANIGIHSLYFSKIAKEGMILAIEPSPKTYNILLRNIYGKKNIIPLNIAIADSTSILDFYEAEDNAYSSLKDTRRKRIKTVHPVVAFSIDQLLSNLYLEQIDLVKIDVEGLEQLVLEGMTDTIAKYKPCIFCEIYKGENSNLRPEGTVDFVCAEGYSAFVVSDGELLPYHSHDDQHYNYVFLPH